MNQRIDLQIAVAVLVAKEILDGIQILLSGRWLDETGDQDWLGYCTKTTM